MKEPEIRIASGARSNLESAVRSGQIGGRHRLIARNINELFTLRDLLEERTGLYFSTEKLHRLDEPFRSPNGSLAKAGLAEVLRALSRDDAQGKVYLNRLIAELTTNETYFFRIPPHFDIIKNYILPELRERQSGTKKKSLRIWSAGCSTGEEPYSIAILLVDSLPDIEEWNIKILATDIDTEALAKARLAVYSPWSFRGVSHRYMQRYFRAASGGKYQLHERIRSLVAFRSLNLKADRYNSFLEGTAELDIIFCRNVTIYFRPETAVRVIRSFHECLRNGGFLFTSPAEMWSKVYDAFETRVFPDTVIYQKPDPIKAPALLIPAVVPTSPAAADQSRTPALVDPDLTDSFPETPQPEIAQLKHEEKPAVADEAARLIFAGEIDHALILLGREIEHGRRDSRVCFLLGLVAADRHHLSEAHHWLAETLTLDPLHLLAHYLRGLLWFNEGDNEAARQAFKKTVYLDQAFVLGHFYLGQTYKRSGDPQRAERSFAVVRKLAGAAPADAVPGVEGITSRTLLDLVNEELSHGR